MDLKEEKKLWKKGYKCVVGLDEAGRGSLAGPVVAAAVILNLKLKSQKSKLQLKTKKLLKEVKDSKKLSQKKREEFYKLIIQSPNIEWGIGRVSEKVIDKINILQATKLAMKKAIENLNKKLRSQNLKADFLIIDGNFNLDLPLFQKSVIKGDEKIFSCALASIIAKVYRDRLMKKHHKKFPQYCFDKNKGYLTKNHYRNIKRYGFCPLHRKSFHYH